MKGICKTIHILGRVAIASMCLLIAQPTRVLGADQEISFILTTNLHARFSLEDKDQDRSDPLLLIAQAILDERRRGGVDLYIDLGNAFWPGLLSKYSSGSVVMDFFSMLQCNATLVSSEDIRIGLEILRSLGAGKRTRLISATIREDGAPVFEPYLVYTKAGISYALLGISSPEVGFDISEKYLYRVKVDVGPDILASVLDDIRGRGIAHVILLSGLNAEETIKLLGMYPHIDMAICGGDNSGTLYGSQATRIDLSDGRPIVLLPESDGFYRLDLSVGQMIAIKELKKHTVVPIPLDRSPPHEKALGSAYVEFSKRLALWKRKIVAEEARVVASSDEPSCVIDDAKIAHLLRDRFDAEVAIVRRGTIRTVECSGEVTRSDISAAIHDDYPIFVYKLRGEDIKNIVGKDTALVIKGTNGKQIQGYPVESTRLYRVSSPQPAFEGIERMVGRTLPFKNTWVHLSELIQSDLETRRVLVMRDHAYLDRRFRTTIDVYLANFFDTARIRTKAATEPPPGWPVDTYKRWGLENKVDITLYNGTHQFVMTPYINYQRQDDTFQQNLLRGTLLYNLNMNEVVRPYQKSQVETVIERAQDGLRPVRIRETVGVYVTKGVFSGKAGVGFEKQVHDPVGDFNLGAEALAQIRYPFHTYLTYTCGLDSFASADFFRSEVENALSVTINRYFGTSAKHKLYYYTPYSGRRNYLNSNIILSLDLKMDAKFW